MNLLYKRSWKFALLFVLMVGVFGCASGNTMMTVSLPKSTPTPINTQTPTATPTPEPFTSEAYAMYSDEYAEWWFCGNTSHKTPSPSTKNAKYNFAEMSAYYVNPNVAEGDKVIYLAFDARYDFGLTNDILDTLAAHNAKASFFVTRSFIRDETELVVRMKKEGHLVGNHSCTHPNLGKSSIETVVKEVTGCAEYMQEKTAMKWICLCVRRKVDTMREHFVLFWIWGIKPSFGACHILTGTHRISRERIM